MKFFQVQSSIFSSDNINFTNQNCHKIAKMNIVDVLFAVCPAGGRRFRAARETNKEEETSLKYGSFHIKLEKLSILQVISTV